MSLSGKMSARNEKKKNQRHSDKSATFFHCRNFSLFSSTLSNGKVYFIDTHISSKFTCNNRSRFIVYTQFCWSYFVWAAAEERDAVALVGSHFILPAYEYVCDLIINSRRNRNTIALFIESA